MVVNQARGHVREISVLFHVPAFPFVQESDFCCHKRFVTAFSVQYGPVEMRASENARSNEGM